MLVLRRKVGESIILDGVICVSVLAVEGERVKIGINAPPDVTILRKELLKILSGEVEVQEEAAAQLEALAEPFEEIPIKKLLLQSSPVKQV